MVMMLKNLPQNPKQTCLNKVHEIALYVFRRMQLKMHSITTLGKCALKCMGIPESLYQQIGLNGHGFPLRNSESAQLFVENLCEL